MPVCYVYMVRCEGGALYTGLYAVGSSGRGVCWGTAAVGGAACSGGFTRA